MSTRKRRHCPKNCTTTLRWVLAWLLLTTSLLGTSCSPLAPLLLSFSPSTLPCSLLLFYQLITHHNYLLQTTKTLFYFDFVRRLDEAANAVAPIDLSKAPPSELRYYIVAHSGLINQILDCLQDNCENKDVELALTTTCRDLSYAVVTARQLTVGGLFDMVITLLALKLSHT